MMTLEASRLIHAKELSTFPKWQERWEIIMVERLGPGFKYKTIWIRTALSLDPEPQVSHESWVSQITAGFTWSGGWKGLNEVLPRAWNIAWYSHFPGLLLRMCSGFLQPKYQIGGHIVIEFYLPWQYPATRNKERRFWLHIFQKMSCHFLDVVRTQRDVALFSPTCSQHRWHGVTVWVASLSSCHCPSNSSPDETLFQLVGPFGKRTPFSFLQNWQVIIRAIIPVITSQSLFWY